MYYRVENGFAAILNVSGERIQSTGESVIDGTLVSRSYIDGVPAIVGTEKISQDRKRIHQRVHGKHNIIADRDSPIVTKLFFFIMVPNYREILLWISRVFLNRMQKNL